MPNCYGFSVDACEALINGALAAAGSGTTAAFSTVVAPTYNPALPDGAVSATISAAGTFAAAAAVTMLLNTSSPPPTQCISRTHFVHVSGTQMSYGKMLVKAQVTCPTDNTVSFTTTIYKCTSRPDPVLAALAAGNWGCAPIASELKSVTVIANVESKQLATAALEGPDPGKWYIASTVGPNVALSLSQETPQ
jgi:hypothetical protein